MSAGNDYTALADALDCFWNASLGSAKRDQDITAIAVASALSEGFSAMAARLREHAPPKGEKKGVTAEDKALAEAFAARLEANAARAEQMKFTVANLSTLKVDECRDLARALRVAIAAAPDAPGEPVAWIVEWEKVRTSDTKYPGGGSEIIRNNRAAVEDKLALLRSLDFVAWAKDTPLYTHPAPQAAVKVKPLEWSLCHTHGGNVWCARGTDKRIREAGAGPREHERVERERDAAQSEYDQETLSRLDLPTTPAPQAPARTYEDGVRDGLRKAAKTATSFLVGDPATGVPLRSPSPHEIEKAILTLIQGE